MAQHKKRNYEVSIWTLQDEFITVLKPSNVENKGQISGGKANIKDDGTLELSFSIPMYYYEGKTRIENSIWYTTKNGMIIQDMRKIKLIFNKDTDVARAFEFLIIDVQESHKGDILTCEISTEGMIFNELGKWGYKVSLSSEEFYARDYDYFTDGKWKDDNGVTHTEEPRGTLQYWLNHFLTPLPANTSNLDLTKWYYSIEMDWSAYSSGRDSDKVYEDEYTGSWNDTGSGYTPKDIVEAKEKERMVNLEESNAYNLTQNLAETFGVFCRYEYLYDSNYHIIGRRVIFYNNYIRENDGYIDLTYPYSTSAITRERDSKDVTTKMFVRPVADDASASGLITILDVAANKSREDYLLNFDYLLAVGGVTPEQYAEINTYQYQVGKRNDLLKKIEGPLIALRSRVPELEAAVTLHTNAIQLDKERISASNDLLNDLDKKDGEVDGTITIGPLAPRTAILKQSSNTDNNGAYYIDLTDHGVVLETLHIYRSYNFTTKQPQTELLTGTPEYDEFGNIIKINNLYITDPTSRTVYLTYHYVPHLYFERVLKTWESRLGTDEAALAKAKNELTNTQNKINTLQEQYDSTLAEKRELVAAFDKMMGPALRESYWQPDDYTDHGDDYVDAFTFSSTATTKVGGSSGYTELIWDTKLFDEEQKTTYEYSAAQTTKYYPCIKLGSQLNYVKQHIDELSFMFYDYISSYPTGRDMHNIRNFPVGSLCQYGFIKNGSSVEPVLILTGAETMSDAQIAEMKLTNHYPKVGVLTTTVTSSGITTTISSSFTVTSDMWVTSATPIYPRIKVGSLALKTSTDMIGLTYNNTELNNYEDYYILTRDDSTVNASGTILTSDAAYYITIEPKTMLREGTITAPVKFKFNLSNADTAIYLDAIQVLKENAYPKVSYTIDPSVVDEDFIYTLYNQLNRICNINDTDLKLENIQGYISELELDLDKPENDRIEIKNYKTKFEDLFTSIVAQTEAMKKSAYTIGLAAQAFTSSGDIDGSVLQNSVMKVDLNYAFNNGKLTIDEKNGIWGVSDSGVVAFRGGGIFTATEKDSAGNWKWNTGIVPQGINADLISTGQLDTNRINIYAGDRVRFQLNGDGLFAYKSFFEDFDITSLSSAALTKINNSSKRIDDLDAAQYVVMNQNGLFLIGEQGALVLNKDRTDYINLTKTVKRVEVSWDGFKLRNWDNEEVFWADPDTGNLNVKGAIYAHSLFVGDDEKDFDEYMSGIEGEILGQTNKVHYGPSAPSSPNEGDIWYDTTNHKTKRYVKKADGTFEWQDITSETLFDALSAADGAQKLAASKTTTFRQATRPAAQTYKVGDIWFNTTNNDQYIAVNTQWVEADWVLYNKNIKGTNLKVDTDNGTITIEASKTVKLAANGVLSITGNGGITMGSQVAINMFAGSSITMRAGSTNSTSAVVAISSSGIALAGGSISLSASAKIEMNSAGTVKIAAQTATGSYVILGAYNDASGNVSGGTVALTDIGLSAPQGSFNSLTINGLSALTTEWVNKKIIVAYAQPAGHDFIWINPSGGGSSGSGDAIDETITFYMNAFPSNKYAYNTDNKSFTNFHGLNSFYGSASGFSSNPSGATYYYTAKINMIAWSNTSSQTSNASISGGQVRATNPSDSSKYVLLNFTGSTLTLGKGNTGWVNFASGGVSTNLFSPSFSTFNAGNVEAKFSGNWGGSRYDIGFHSGTTNEFSARIVATGGGGTSGGCSVEYIP